MHAPDALTGSLGRKESSVCQHLQNIVFSSKLLWSKPQKKPTSSEQGADAALGGTNPLKPPEASSGEACLSHPCHRQELGIELTLELGLAGSGARLQSPFLFQPQNSFMWQRGDNVSVFGDSI